MSTSPQSVTFVCDGLRLSGSLYLPSAAAGPGPYPAVAIGSGWSGRRQTSVEGRAFQLADEGFVALTFDYRGYGDSEGTAQRLHPQEWAADIRAAAAFLRSRGDVDPARVAVMGPLTGGSAALQAAIDDPAIAAVVALFPVGDGERWLRIHRAYWEWLELVERLEQEARSTAAGEAPQIIDSNEVRILPPDDELRATGLRERGRMFSLASTSAIRAFRPEDSVHRIAPRAVMVVAVEGDLMMPLAEVQDFYGKVREPKQLLIVPGDEHREVGGRIPDRPYPLNSSIADIAAFLRESMPRTRRAEQDWLLARSG